MTQKETDAIFIFNNCTVKNCVRMIKKYDKDNLPVDEENYYNMSYKRKLQETICDIFIDEILKYNLYFTTIWN